jgi:hypothetical protein
VGAVRANLSRLSSGLVATNDSRKARFIKEAQFRWRIS